MGNNAIDTKYKQIRTYETIIRGLGVLSSIILANRIDIKLINIKKQKLVASSFRYCSVII